ncbi:MAG: YicC family protein [Planctomycetes bacterium]|nr:YicC family protein [Planctomycetota bacterium]
MIHSMTGYGDANGQLDSVTYVVEIKTVNNRYFKARVKLPDSAAFLEEEIEALLRKSLSRGTISYVLELKNIPVSTAYSMDEPAMRIIVGRLEQIAKSFDANCTIDLTGILTLPGIARPRIPDKEVAEKVRNKVLSITHEAIEKLKQMRATEGESLAADLYSNCGVIEEELKKIQARSDGVLIKYAKKLSSRVNKLLSEAKLKLDEETLAREVAVFADRSDISEEISRLGSHIKQFIESCEKNGQAGRRLDFITQEMLREANTIASKASNIEIIQSVVNIKSSIDRIKEQVQNVE